MEKGYYKVKNGLILHSGHECGGLNYITEIGFNGDKRSYWTERKYKRLATLMDIDKIYSALYDQFLEKLGRL